MIKIFYVVDKESENEKTRKKWNVKWTRRGHVMRSRMARTSIKKSESEKWKEQESGATKCALIDCFNNFTLEWCKQKAKTLTILYIGPISFRPLRHPWIFFTHKKKPYLLGMEMGKPSTKPSHTFLSLSSTTSQMINTNPRIRQTQPQEQPHK